MGHFIKGRWITNDTTDDQIVDNLHSMEVLNREEHKSILDDIIETIEQLAITQETIHNSNLDIYQSIDDLYDETENINTRVDNTYKFLMVTSFLESIIIVALIAMLILII